MTEQLPLPIAPRPYPKKGPALPCDAELQAQVEAETREVSILAEQLEQRRMSLRQLEVKRGAVYACRCCGMRHTRPLGLFDHNQCVSCFDGIHDYSTCTNKKKS